jgi:hypothetical protein
MEISRANVTDLDVAWGLAAAAPQSKPIHMLKGRSGSDVFTRCGSQIKIKPIQSIMDVHVTGWETYVTCPSCQWRQVPRDPLRGELGDEHFRTVQ